MKPLKVCESIMDEFVNYFYFEKNVTNDFLNNINGKITGCHDDNEFLKVKVQNIKKIFKINSFSTIVGSSLLENKLKNY